MAVLGAPQERIVSGMMEDVTLKTENEELPFWSLSWASTVRDTVTSLSLANLCFLRVWEETLAYRKGEAYLMKQLPGPSDYLATITAVFLLAAFFFALVWLCRRYLSLPAFRVVRFASFALALIPKDWRYDTQLVAIPLSIDHELGVIAPV